MKYDLRDSGLEGPSQNQTDRFTTQSCSRRKDECDGRERRQGNREALPVTGEEVAEGHTWEQC